MYSPYFSPSPSACANPPTSHRSAVRPPAIDVEGGGGGGEVSGEGEDDDEEEEIS